MRCPAAAAASCKARSSILQGQPVVFDGHLALRGTSMARFLTWAASNTLPIEAKADGAFGLRAQITAGNGKVAARDIVGNLSGTTLSGAAQYRWDGRPEVTIALEGPQIDARSFIPAGASLVEMYDFLLRGPEGKQADAQRPAPAKPGWRGAQTDLSLRVSAGQLLTAGRTYRDVTAAMELKGGHLRQLQLRLAGDEGYTVELDGRVDDVSTRPKGSVRGLAKADTAAGVAPLVELAGIPAALRPTDSRGQAAVPLRLAGSMTFGGRAATSADLMVDGNAGGTAVRLNARLDGGADGWRTGRADITATVDSADGARVARLLLPDGALGGSELRPCPDQGDRHSQRRPDHSCIVRGRRCVAELPRPGDACRSGHQDVGRPRLPRQRQRAARRAGRSVAVCSGRTACRSAAGSVSPWETAASASRGLRPTSAQAGWRDT